MPYFSIIIPTYNRANLLPRALASCFAQGFDDFEVIVVDDASADETRALLRDYRDPRLRIIENATQRGVCAARNVGVDAARGLWFVFLDSDDELAPRALELLYRITRNLKDPNVAHVRSKCRWDDRHETPSPLSAEEVWTYEEYVRSLDRYTGRNGEALPCIRADTFKVLRFPDDRSYEGQYHLDFAKRFKTLVIPVVTRLYHTDADNQISFAPDVEQWRRVADDVARSTEGILKDHGAALQQWAPRTFVLQHRLAAKLLFLAGNRRRALGYAVTYLRRRPLSVAGWSILVFGLLLRHVLRGLVDRVAPGLATALRDARDARALRRLPMPVTDAEPEVTEFLRRELLRCDAFVDVGANIGAFTLLARSMGKRVIAVEPLPVNARALRRNLARAGYANDPDIEVRQLGLAESMREGTLYGGGTGASLLPGWAGASAAWRHDVELWTMDLLLAGRFVGQRLLIKLDVEGAELAVLKGAPETLARVPKPVWLVEVCFGENFPPGAVNPHFAETFDVFRSAGYRAYGVEAGMREVSPSDVRRWLAQGRRDFGYVSYAFRGC